MNRGHERNSAGVQQSPIWHPRFWWIARRSDLSWLTDPDVKDQRTRWNDKNEIDWVAVADVVDAVATQLDRDDVVADRDRYSDDGQLLWLDCGVERLGKKERLIIDGWFQSEIPPRFDPWHRSLTDGRHRLWSVWQARPNARVPVRSLILPYATAGSTIREDRNYAKLLRDVSWFDPSTGANRRYAVNLRWVMQEGNYFELDHRDGPGIDARVDDFPVPEDVATRFDVSWPPLSRSPVWRDKIFRMWKRPKVAPSVPPRNPRVQS